MEMQNTNENLAIKYLGRGFIIAIVGSIILSLANLGYNTYIKFTSTEQEKRIEVNSQNSNSINSD